MKLQVSVDWAIPGTLPEAGQTYTDGGPVNVTVTPQGPAGHPTLAVQGGAGAVLEWLLSEYVADDLDGALELLATAAQVG